MAPLKLALLEMQGKGHETLGYISQHAGNFKMLVQLKT